MKSVNVLRNQRGMTLIEIMIVLIIISGLAAVLGGNVRDQFQKSKVKNAKIQISELSKALDLYYTDCNRYPTTEQGLKALVEAPTTSPSCGNWGPKKYVKKAMLEDPWNNEFEYELNGSTDFIITSFGQDGEPDGEGLAADLSNLEEDEE